MNPVSDICWSCTWPLRLGNGAIFVDNQEDNNVSSGSSVCRCGTGANVKVGARSEFWEPARIFEATRTPHCYPSLGGIKLDTGIEAASHARSSANHEGSVPMSFYQAHWYINPIFFWLEVLMDNSCLEQGVFDLAYATEYDPLWDDDLMSFLIAPDSALFANAIATVACTADCVAATAGFPLSNLFWCAGCQGAIYPLTGFVATHLGGVQTSNLLMQRFTNKLHRQGLMWAASGEEGLCKFFPQVVMDKGNYKAQMIYPVPNTQKILGRCCQPFGRTTMVWGAGKEIPYVGEDFAYQVFRKKSCCAGGSPWQMAAPG
jgi:conjugal transfer pilus assembly protein TraU